MNNNSDPLFERYADLDFADAKPVSAIPALARLQAEQGGESQITIGVDNTILAFFKARAEMAGCHYQMLINEALQQFVRGQTLADVVRATLREELRRV